MTATQGAEYESQMHSRRSTKVLLAFTLWAPGTAVNDFCLWWAVTPFKPFTLGPIINRQTHNHPYL